MVTKIIKASGGDYTSINAAITGENPLTDDTDLIVSSDIIESAAITIITLNGYTLRIYSDTPHNGNYNVGWKVFTHNGSSAYLYIRPVFGGGKVVVNDLIVTSENYNVANRPLLNIIASPGSGEIEVYNNIFNCVNDSGVHKAQGVNITLAHANQTAKIYNNKVYKSVNSGISLIQNTNVNTLATIENNTIDDCNPSSSASHGGLLVRTDQPPLSTNAITIKNNVLINNGYEDLNMFNTPSVAYMDSNSDTDGSCAAVVPVSPGYNNGSATIVPSSEFISDLYTNVDYLKINKNSLGLKDTGTLPVYALYDMAGVERGVDGRYSRGCYEFNSNVPGVYTSSIYWDFDSAPKTDEIANLVNVKALPVSLDTVTSEVFNSTDEIEIPVSGTIDITINFDILPVDPSTVVTTITDIIGTSTISVEKYYAWGGYLTITGSAGNTFILSAIGKKGLFQSESVKSSEDSDSILEYGKQVYTLEDNHLIQTNSLAASIATTLLSNYKDVRQDVSIGWPGDNIVELADRVTCEEYKDNSIETIGNFYIVRQNIKFDGSLNVSTDLRRRV